MNHPRQTFAYFSSENTRNEDVCLLLALFYVLDSLKNSPVSFFLLFYFCAGVALSNGIVLVSGVQQSAWYTYIYVGSFSPFPFKFGIEYWAESLVLYTVGPCCLSFEYSSVYMSILMLLCSRPLWSFIGWWACLGWSLESAHIVTNLKLHITPWILPS